MESWLEVLGWECWVGSVGLGVLGWEQADEAWMRWDGKAGVVGGEAEARLRAAYPASSAIGQRARGCHVVNHFRLPYCLLRAVQHFVGLRFWLMEAKGLLLMTAIDKARLWLPLCSHDCIHSFSTF